MRLAWKSASPIAQIVFLRDIRAFLDEQPVDLFALGAGLVRDQYLAQKLRGIGFDFIYRFCQLYAAGLAAAASMDLSLYDADLGAQLLCCLYSLLHAECRLAVRDVDAVRFQDLLALVLMNIHILASLFDWTDKVYQFLVNNLILYFFRFYVYSLSIKQ